MEYLYRYERYYIGEYEYEPVHVRLLKFIIKRTTPKGFWISDYGREKWVSNDCKKRYAYPTTGEAMDNFKARTNRCVKLLKSQLRCAEKFQSAIKTNTLVIIESSYSLS